MNYNKIVIHSDGGARGNPGPAAYGVVINSDGEVTTLSEKVGHTTNNVAEYSGVVAAFENLVAAGNRGVVVEVYLDSQLIVRQLSGVYKIKMGHLMELCKKVKSLEKEVGDRVTYIHIPREENKEADKLVNLALDA